jgi:hypothetical protein
MIFVLALATASLPSLADIGFRLLLYAQRSHVAARHGDLRTKHSFLLEHVSQVSHIYRAEAGRRALSAPVVIFASASEASIRNWLNEVKVLTPNLNVIPITESLLPISK